MRSLLYYFMTWISFWIMSVWMIILLHSQGRESSSTGSSSSSRGSIAPNSFVAPLEEYPNALEITESDRATFAPVVKFPMIWMDDDSGQGRRRRRVPNYRILDHTTTSAKDELATEGERRQARSLKKKERQKVTKNSNHTGFAVGRYDENRINLYASDMFEDSHHAIDGYAGQRTVHIGIDLDGPVGTKVYSFAKGMVHQAGYNADLGDYGNVIVVKHTLDQPFANGTERILYALYGHLNDDSIVGLVPGKTRIKKGQCLGRMGDIHENGGWRIPHVHFQLSLQAPETHDMPGVVSVRDRPRALWQYPDPRLVLGRLY